MKDKGYQLRFCNRCGGAWFHTSFKRERPDTAAGWLPDDMAVIYERERALKALCDEENNK
jgi:hypothetical protein